MSSSSIILYFKFLNRFLAKKTNNVVMNKVKHRHEQFIGFSPPAENFYKLNQCCHQVNLLLALLSVICLIKLLLQVQVISVILQ